MTTRVKIKPSLLAWACQRNGWEPEKLEAAFPKLSEWLDGASDPTLKQLEGFAARTHTALGYFFLDAPPKLSAPIPDLRTMGSRELLEPSPALLATIDACTERQAWYREFQLSEGTAGPAFVGTTSLNEPPEGAAQAMRHILELSRDPPANSAEDAFRQLRNRIEDAGVLVMTSRCVGNSQSHRLNVGEFRGFSLHDSVAPLVFINGVDSRSAQLFTLAHELGHVVLGHSAISDPSFAPGRVTAEERWCNAFAAEMLVPMHQLKTHREPRTPDEVGHLARVFGVSRLVIIRRMADAKWISEDRMWTLYRDEEHRLESLSLKRSHRDGPGPTVYVLKPFELGRRFTEAVLADEYQGRTRQRDAHDLLGIKKRSTFEELRRRLGVYVYGERVS